MYRTGVVLVQMNSKRDRGMTSVCRCIITWTVATSISFQWLSSAFGDLVEQFIMPRGFSNITALSALVVAVLELTSIGEDEDGGNELTYSMLINGVISLGANPSRPRPRRKTWTPCHIPQLGWRILVHSPGCPCSHAFSQRVIESTRASHVAGLRISTVYILPVVS